MLEERSVARCAERLFVSPSAVSHALARLRTMFSDPLFVRTGSGMLPTARAQSLERSLSLLKALLAAELETDRVSATEVPFEPGESVRDVRIVSPGALELSLLPTLATMLRARAPQWSLTIEPFERRSYETDLATGRVDFVLWVGGTTPIGRDRSRHRPGRLRPFGRRHNTHRTTRRC
ncbi:LysR family transcriptional regulator [Sinorhizobium medicae]|uniref:LysR family transcriptional regulator n=1 Tax=Sinorhizobium medicae TaxID=110321 RepID=UPI0027DD756D|nr:LysR family transcriptional regulator [Sinorhizobium medicae]